MRSHTDEAIIERASNEEKDLKAMKNNRLDVAVDMDDEHGTAHTYVVNFCKADDGSWKALEVSEISSL
jgi:hypothetical protein